ncbi:MAG: GTPase HflX [Thermoleophilia bacterium]|nr:GTPase HflX [Thermoleophilia bacterium]
MLASLPREEDAEERIGELTELLRTAGAETIATIIQRREMPDSRTYLGKGRLEEVKEIVEREKPELVVAEGELSPGQQRALEDRLNTRVVDRTAVILDIFALHATTAEGKLQVELAQLEYYYARQEGLWQHLERLGGGLGTRGPGETQLEVDRRLIRTRMGRLRRRLSRVAGSRALRRRNRQRSEVPRVALAGYTNAGKSSLMNALTHAGVSANDALFETLDSTTRTIEHEGWRVLLSDTVGFIRHLPHQLVEAFASTLDEVKEADLLLHVVDASEPEHRREAQITAAESVLKEIGADEIPRALVLNKIDLIDADGRAALAHRASEGLQVSAASGEGIELLRERLAELAKERMVDVQLIIPYHRGDLIAAVHADGHEVVQETNATGMHLRAMLPVASAGRIKAALAEDQAPS